MEDQNQIKRLILVLMIIFSLAAIVACSSNDDGKDNDTEKKNEKESVEKTHGEETIETQIENDVLRILAFSEEKDKIERYGMNDEGSDDQSIHVNDNDGDLELFLSVSKESTGIDSAGDGPMVGLDVRHDFKRDKESLSKIEDITKELIKAISKYEYVDWIGIEHRIEKDEDSNNTKALSVSVERKTLDKISWDTFDSDKLESIVDDYTLADDLE